MARYVLEQVHEDRILNALVLPDEVECFNDCNYFGTDRNWYYTNGETNYILSLKGSDDYNYCIQFSFSAKIKRMTIMVEEPGQDEFEDLDDNSKCAVCKFYEDEGQYFMDSTVKSLRISFKLMQAVKEFCINLEKVTHVE